MERVSLSYQDKPKDYKNFDLKKFILEQFIKFNKEISVIVVRSKVI